MKKTEYFMHQMSYGQWQQCLDNVKNKRDAFIKDTNIEKIVCEDIVITNITASHEINIVIKLTYF